MGRVPRSRRTLLLAALCSALWALLVGCGPRGVTFHAQRTPERLGDWGLFEIDGSSLRPADGVLAYELNTSLFSDYAHKLRTVWMPEGVTASADATGRIIFPEGSILSKTFYYPTAGERSEGVVRAKLGGGVPLDFSAPQLDLAQVHLVETRLLVRREFGWVTLPYVWNDEQIGAELKLIGAEQRVVLEDSEIGEFLYIMPDANQCSGCHVTDMARGEPQPIGPQLRHLNRKVSTGAGSREQLDLWVERGFLEPVDAATAPRAARAFSPDGLPEFSPDGSLEDHSLEERARSYLDINCGHCHSATGPADTSGLFLDATVEEKRRLGFCKPPIAAGRGSGDRLVSIHPGQPEASIMTFRMASTDPGIAMPELGRSTIHREGVELIREWIESLDGECQPALGRVAGL